MKLTPISVSYTISIIYLIIAILDFIFDFDYMTLIWLLSSYVWREIYYHEKENY